MPVVLVEKKTPQITVVTLNRPERRNALSIQLLTELIASIKLASDEIRERILILSGAGAAFCTGLDLKEGARDCRFGCARAWRAQRGASSNHRGRPWSRGCRWRRHYVGL